MCYKEFGRAEAAALWLLSVFEMSGTVLHHGTSPSLPGGLDSAHHALVGGYRCLGSWSNCSNEFSGSVKRNMLGAVFVAALPYHKDLAQCLGAVPASNRISRLVSCLTF
jgi:hypothetical protein